ncbi:hypothetical protein LT679_03705 [Mucilaginibacter roseus]|uniref:Nucleotidyltransferase-Associated Rossmannoid Fold domain-containing protein n=1 Tax=Mucilaginibacter roseus TaxID=1528868 RepID=A0ABS8TXU4_9SPHI|nr:NARF domain-containing protein [Mucilaginibacter roseus]MCD8739699.1 hypothetical protein [Mucilaginibacter roseus]
MKIFRLLTVVLCFSAWQYSFAKSDPKVSELELRVKAVEQYQQNIELRADARAETLKNQVDKDVKAGLEKIEDAQKQLDLLLFLGVPGTVGAFLIGFVGIIIYVRKLVTNTVASIVEKKRDDIIRLIETETFDNKLRNTKKILVISGDEDTNEKIQTFLKRLKFKKVVCRVVGTFDELPDHDLMVFNTPNGELTQEKIDELMALNEEEDVHYVAYSTGRLTPNSKLNFSNSLFTLYHSILSTLKYAEVIRLIEDANDN